MLRCYPVVVFLALMLEGCSPQSLVGVEELAPDSVLAEEWIQIRLKPKVESEDGDQRLFIITLAPNNTVRASRIFVNFLDPSGDLEMSDPEVNEESVRTERLSTETALEVRRQLARLRPETLSANWSFAFAPDCPGMSSHPDNVAAVSFARDERTGGMFLLERPCTTIGAARVLNLINDVSSKMGIWTPSLTR